MKNYKRKDFIAPEKQYIRVGVDIFKVIDKPDRFGTIRQELKKWNKDTFLIDHDKKHLYSIPAYDDFIMEPDNRNGNTVISGCYNMYRRFPHVPKEGCWPWTLVLMKQIFGTQLKIGMQYMKVLYENPKQALPILVMVSEERSTGKSTFFDWLNMLFGANMVMIEPDVIGSSFNAEYATANIIGIDESIIEKQTAVEKIKSLATKKFISVNMKNVSQFTLPFYGKIIMASNNEDKFIRIDEPEIRYWVRKLSPIKVNNHNILYDMLEEIPAFLHYLENMPDIDYSQSRMVFTPEQLANDDLKRVKEESRSSLYKEITEYLTDWFLNNNYDQLILTPGDIKEKWFLHNNRIDINYIRKVLKNEFKLSASEKTIYYEPFFDMSKKNGRPFVFNRSSFVQNNDVENQEVMPF